MPSYQTLLPSNIYSFLDEMSQLYSQIEREMHVRLMAEEKISEAEKSLSARYQVDSTTVRNVYHNLKGKHKSIRELQKTQAKDLKASIKNLEKSIHKWIKRSNKKIKQNNLTIVNVL